MDKLLLWLGGIFAGASADFITRLIRVTVYIAAVLALTTGLILLFNSLVSGLASSLSPETLQLASALLPDNFNASISIIISARLARWAYDWNVSFASKLASG